MGACRWRRPVVGRGGEGGDAAGAASLAPLGGGLGSPGWPGGGGRRGRPGTPRRGDDRLRLGTARGVCGGGGGAAANANANANLRALAAAAAAACVCVWGGGAARGPFRVAGPTALAVSRAIGDMLMKEPRRLVVADPETKCFDLSPQVNNPPTPSPFPPPASRPRRAAAKSPRLTDPPRPPAAAARGSRAKALPPCLVAQRLDLSPRAPAPLPRPRALPPDVEGALPRAPLPLPLQQRGKGARERDRGRTDAPPARPPARPRAHGSGGGAHAQDEFLVIASDGLFDLLYIYMKCI